MLTQKRAIEIFDYNPETGDFFHAIKKGNQKKGWKAGHVDFKGRVYLSADGRNYFAHRVAWLYVNGEWPSAAIDHIDGNQTNNAISNLRLATHSENEWNQGKRKCNTSGYKNVSWKPSARKYRASFGFKGKTIFVGYFDDPKEAFEAYKAKAALYHGEFLNTGDANA